ncbi:MAG: hypothetical protein WBD20_11550 [Pirellulaceae bacterium]
MLLLVPMTGCRICASSEDLAYPSYGGAWQRTVRDSGRVASLFDPAGAKSSELVSRDNAVTQDELERRRRDNESTNDDKSSDEDLPDGDSQGTSPENGSGNDDTPNLDPDEDLDPELRRRMEELRDQDLDDVKIIPGDALPPMLR